MRPVKVPLQLINLQNDGFHLLVEVVVFGQSFNLVLDTGASKTVIDKETLEQFVSTDKILQSEQFSTGLGTSEMPSFTLTLPQIKIGKLKIKDFDVAVLDLSTITQAYRALNLPPVIGVLGGDLLHLHRAVIDYNKTELKLHRIAAV